jgi:hypothetical protein
MPLWSSLPPAAALSGSDEFVIDQSGAFARATLTEILAAFSGVSTVTNSDGTLDIAPTSGPVVASLDLANFNIWQVEQYIFIAGSRSAAIWKNTTPATSLVYPPTPGVGWASDGWDDGTAASVLCTWSAEGNGTHLPSTVGVSFTRNRWVLSFDAVDSLSAQIESATGIQVDSLGNVYISHLVGTPLQSTLNPFPGPPAIGTGTGAGAHATASIGGFDNDLRGTITINTSVLDTPAANADIATVTFNAPYLTGAATVVFWPTNDAAWDLPWGVVRIRQADTTTTVFKLRSGSVPLPPLTSATYLFSYLIVG